GPIRTILHSEDSNCSDSIRNKLVAQEKGRSTLSGRPFHVLFGLRPRSLAPLRLTVPRFARILTIHAIPLTVRNPPFIGSNLPCPTPSNILKFARWRNRCPFPRPRI